MILDLFYEYYQNIASVETYKIDHKSVYVGEYFTLGKRSQKIIMFCVKTFRLSAH